MYNISRKDQRSCNLSQEADVGQGLVELENGKDVRSDRRYSIKPKLLIYTHNLTK